MMRIQNSFYTFEDAPLLIINAADIDLEEGGSDYEYAG